MESIEVDRIEACSDFIEGVATKDVAIGGGGEEEAVDAVAGDDVGERRRANVGVDDVRAFDQEIGSSRRRSGGGGGGGGSVDAEAVGVAEEGGEEGSFGEGQEISEGEVGGEHVEAGEGAELGGGHGGEERHGSGGGLLKEKDGVAGEEERDASACERAEVMRQKKGGGEVGVSTSRCRSRSSAAGDLQSVRHLGQHGLSQRAGCGSLRRSSVHAGDGGNREEEEEKALELGGHVAGT